MKTALLVLMICFQACFPARGDPVLEWSSSEHGPWIAVPGALVVEKGDGDYDIFAPPRYPQPFYRLRVDETVYPAINIHSAVHIRFREPLGEEITILLPGNVPLELRLVPSGSFQMGSPATERSRNPEEGPRHTVTISDDFYMGIFEVTQRQWLAVMGTWPGNVPSAIYGLGDDFPAYHVSWNDAQAFINALNNHIQNSGQGPLTVRLPSEAEWEYACRAGTQTRFSFGDSLDVNDLCADSPNGIRSAHMWYCGNNNTSGMKRVGLKQPNAFGLYDMHGNALEWCEDWWHDNYNNAPANGAAWLSPAGSVRVVRNGYWNDFAEVCRSASRNSSPPGYSNIVIGFRVAADP